MPAIDPMQLLEALQSYEESAPFARVENDRLETLPTAFREGTVLWKDVEWIVRWYCRRPLDGSIHPAEEAFRTNDMHDIREAIDASLSGTGIADRIDPLCSLTGVDVPIATGFLHFMSPAQFAVVDARSWHALDRLNGQLGPFPEEMTTNAYRTYLNHCRDLAEATDIRPVDVTRALWQLGSEK